MPTSNTGPDIELWSTTTGGGNSLVQVDGDAGTGSGTVGYNLHRFYTSSADNSATTTVAEGFYLPKDIVFDTVHGKFFIADSDLAGHNRILQGNIADLLSGAPPAMTILYNDGASGTATRIDNLEVDPNSGQVYFTHGQRFEKVAYNTALQTPTILMNFGSGSGNPAGSTNNFFNDFVVNFTTGDVYLSSTRVVAAADGDSISRNYIYHLTGLTASSGAGSFSFAGGTASMLPFSPQDDETGTTPPLSGEAFPMEQGALDGLAIDIATNTLYFTTGPVQLDHDSNPGTAPVLVRGGIFSYALTGNPTGTYTEIFSQDGVTGPVGQMSDIEIDPTTGRWYVADINGGTPGNGDEAIWTGNLNGTGTPTLFTPITTAGGEVPSGFTIDIAPTLVGVATGAAASESAGSGSGFSVAVQPLASFTAFDYEAPDQSDQLVGAKVRIATGFGSSPGSSERLTINGTTSGTLDFGTQDITYSYNALTGVMTLTGASTLDNYEAALALVSYAISGDNPDNYGASPTRTLAYSISDGLLWSDENTVTVAIAATNDGPVNTTGGAIATSEDGGPVAVTGLSVSDVDANPASDTISVTLDVGLGTISVSDSVSGGLTAAQISGNGTGTVVLSGTQNQINATLAAAGGVSYTPDADANGSDTLTITSNDLGHGGAGGAQQDQDQVAITIGAIADIADDSATTDEDTAVAIPVLANDSFEGTPAITGFGQGAHGSVVLNDNGTAGDTSDDFLVYTPDADYHGTDSFSYTVTSGGVTESATVDVAIDAVADIADDDVTVAEDSGANALDLLANDSFEDPGRAITAVTQGVNGGTVTINDNGTAGDTSDDYVTYTAAPDYTGPDSFTYTVTSGGSTETATVNVDVTPENDAPVNGTGGPATATEDASSAVTGLSVTDIDSASISVTLAVTRGTLTIDTGVFGGVGAGQVSDNGTDSVTLTGSPAQINATLAAMNGVVYTPTPNVNGPDTLTMTSDDGFNQDVDVVAIGVAAVNDAPIVAGDGTESAAPIVQDMPSATGQSVAALFAGQYSDATDQVAGGSSADAFAGVAVTANGSGAAGQWQYFNGSSWVNIGAASDSSAVLLSASTSIRFNPAAGFSGAAPTLTAHLVDASGGALTSGSVVNASATGGTTRYSGGTVTLDQTVISGNTPPTGVTGNLHVTEDAANGTVVGTVTATDPDSSTFTYTLVNDAGGRFDISASGVVTVQNGLLLDYEQAHSHTIRVQVDDHEGGVSQFDMNVGIDDDHGEFVTGDNANNVFYGGAETDILLGGHGVDTIHGGGGIDIITGGTGLIDSTDDGDFLFGEGGSDVIDGNGGNDVIAGGADADVVVGGYGNDTIYGGASASDTTDNSNDVLSGDWGNDLLYGNGGNDLLYGGDDSDQLFGGTGTDTLDGGSGNDTLYGGAAVNDSTDTGGDELTGGLGNDILYGNGGNDFLYGGDDLDQLFGGAGTDRLDGGNGNDTLNGGAGADTLTGGLGNDVFVFRKGEANGDVIADFRGNGSAAGDSIRLEGYAAGTTFTRIGSSDNWRINDHGSIEVVTIHATGSVHSSDYGFF